MGFGNNTRESESNSSIEAWPRRAVLRITGAAAGAAALGGGAAVGAGQENGHGHGTDEEDTGDDAHFVEDLIDPTFGYPLAAGETDDVDVEQVVELYTEEGEGDHENFPRPLDPEEAEGSGFPFEFVFDPVGLQVTTDDVVKFHDLAGEHTITAFHEKFSIPQRAVPTRVPDGVPGFTSPPIVDDESWLYQFPAAGVYDIFCLPHMPFGMVARVVVTEPDGDGTDGDAFTAPTADELPPNAAAVLNAPELEPSNVVDQGSVAWADVTIETAGAAMDGGDGAETGPANETGIANETGAGTGGETENG